MQKLVISKRICSYSGIPECVFYKIFRPHFIEKLEMLVTKFAILFFLARNREFFSTIFSTKYPFGVETFLEENRVTYLYKCLKSIFVKWVPELSVVLYVALLCANMCNLHLTLSGFLFFFRWICSYSWNVLKHKFVKIFFAVCKYY